MEAINITRPVIALVLAAVFGHCNQSCKPASGPSVSDLYAMELMGCVEKSHSKEEFKECRTAVDKKYGLCAVPEKQAKLDFCKGI